MQICITNLSAYNDGKLIYKWVSLPTDPEKIQAAIQEITTCDDEEIFLSDWDDDGNDGLINEYTNPFTINKFAQEIDQLSPYDYLRFSYLVEHEGYSFEEAMEKFDSVIFYENQKLIDVAYELVEEGCFGEISSTIRAYIDYEAVARDLSFEGYVQTSDGVAYYN